MKNCILNFLEIQGYKVETISEINAPFVVVIKYQDMLRVNID
jgi:hypothetical protein